MRLISVSGVWSEICASKLSNGVFSGSSNPRSGSFGRTVENNHQSLSKTSLLMIEPQESRNMWYIVRMNRTLSRKSLGVFSLLKSK